MAKEELEDVIRTAHKIGIGYSDLMQMDIREFNQAVEGYIDAREEKLNDEAVVAHRGALKIAQAVYGSRDFRDSIADFELRPKSEEEIIKERLAAMRALTRRGGVTSG